MAFQKNNNHNIEDLEGLRLHLVRKNPKNNGLFGPCHIRFMVIDTGVGISPQELNKIFSPFEQVGQKSYKAANQRV